MAHLSVAIVGCGKVGTAFGRLLKKAGHTIVGVSTNHEATAKKAAEILGTPRFSEKPWQLTAQAQVVFITTPDDVIKKTCQVIAKEGGFQKGSVVIHCSGALPSSILSSARDCGASVASLHPLQSFSSAKEAELLVGGSYCTVEGDPQALPTVRRLTQDLKGRLLEISSDGKSLYHAAAVVASNYLVALIHTAQCLFKSAGLPPEVSFDALSPLVQGTLKNIEKLGIPKALTGPIARGDIATVEAHLDAIKESAPGFLETYRILGQVTIDLAQRKGTLAPGLAAALLSLLESGEKVHGC